MLKSFYFVADAVINNGEIVLSLNYLRMQNARWFQKEQHFAQLNFNLTFYHSFLTQVVKVASTSTINNQTTLNRFSIFLNLKNGKKLNIIF